MIFIYSTTRRSFFIEKLLHCLKSATILIAVAILPYVALAHGQNQWSTLFYYTSTSKKTFGEVLVGEYDRFGEDLYTAECAYSLPTHNVFRSMFYPIFNDVWLATNLTYRRDYHNHDCVMEGNLYVVWRFNNFPWNSYLKNSVAIGDGISYASHPPFADREVGQEARNFSRFLNYMMLEITFASPRYERLELVIRLHHRCTAWGTFPKDANAGSTGMGVGIRFYW